MLSQILAEFQQAHGPLCLDELSRKLDIETSALEGMLQTLVRRGRLLEMNPTHPGCVACPARGGCVILTNGVQKSYFLILRNPASRL
jgi:hypothetical protein